MKIVYLFIENNLHWQKVSGTKQTSKDLFSLCSYHLLSPFNLFGSLLIIAF